MAQITTCIGTISGQNTIKMGIVSFHNIQEMRDLIKQMFGHTVGPPQQLKGQNIEYQCFVPFFVFCSGQGRDTKNKGQRIN